MAPEMFECFFTRSPLSNSTSPSHLLSQSFSLRLSFYPTLSLSYILNNILSFLSLYLIISPTLKYELSHNLSLPIFSFSLSLSLSLTLMFFKRLPVNGGQTMDLFILCLYSISNAALWTTRQLCLHSIFPLCFYLHLMKLF